MPSLKEQFLLDPDVHFLNHGSFGATSLPTLMALTYMCLGLTMFTISHHRKISLHTAGGWRFFHSAGFRVRRPTRGGIPESPLVAWARMRRRTHAGAVGCRRADRNVDHGIGLWRIWKMVVR